MSHQARIAIQALSVFTSKGERPAQEDFALAAPEKGVFVIADGFGGPAPGAAASKAACESVRDFLFREGGDLEATLPFVLRSYFSLAGNVLFNALIHANRKVSLLNKGKSVHERGGAAVLAGFLDGDLLALASAGHCAAWLFRGGEAVELVIPRSYGRLLDPTSLDVPEAHSAPLMALGLSEDLEPEIFEYRMRPGDWLVLHTDGLMAQDRERLRLIQATGISTGASPATSAEKAGSFLNQLRFRDNVAVSLVIF